MANTETPVEDTKPAAKKRATTAAKTAEVVAPTETPAAETPAEVVVPAETPAAETPVVEETPAENEQIAGEDEEKPAEDEQIAGEDETPAEIITKPNRPDHRPKKVTLAITNNGPRSFEVYTKTDLPAGKTVEIECRNQVQANSIKNKLTQLNNLARKQRYTFKEV